MMFRTGFGERIRPFVDDELRAAAAAETGGDPVASFRHLERAHVLGQASTIQHVRAHYHMLMWAIRQRSFGEVTGQVLRVIVAAMKTAIKRVPIGNTGGSNVSPFQSMPVPKDLAAIIARASVGPPVRILTALLIVATLVSASGSTIPPRDVRRVMIGDPDIAYYFEIQEAA